MHVLNNPAIKKSEYALAIFGLGLLLLAAATSLHYKNLNLFILELFCDVVAAACLYLQPKSQSSGDAIRQITVLVVSSILSSFLLVFIILAGAKTFGPFDLDAWNIASLVICFHLVLAFQGIELCYGLVKSFVISVKKTDARKCLIFLAVSVGFAVLIAFIGIPLDKSKTVLFASALPITVLIGLIAISGGISYLKPELFAFACIVSVGLSVIICFPVTNFLTWDDEVHYGNANSFSYLTNAEITNSDRMIVEQFYMGDGFSLDASLGKYPIDETREFNRGSVEQVVRETDKNDIAEGIDRFNSFDSVALSKIAYIPSSIGLCLGRLLHLPFSIKFALGKIFNLLAYAVICGIAIRIAPCRKCLFTCIALFPSAVLMAASYSYDPCVISFSLLGTALLLKMLVSEEDISAKTFFGFLLSFAVGFAAKAIYFPLFGLALLIPANKYTSSKQRRILIGTAIFVCAIMILSFLTPYFSSVVNNISDARGGTEVSTAGQTTGVLANPVGTIAVISNFVFGSMLTPAFLNSISTNMAYLGDVSNLFPWLSYLPIMLFEAICIIDNEKVTKIKLSRCGIVWSLFLVLATCYLVALALYIAFTGVGSQTVAGVQARYLIPLLIPFACLLLRFPIYCDEEEKTKCAAFMLGAPFSLLYFVMFELLYIRFL